jgi:hypothetical protein
VFARLGTGSDGTGPQRPGGAPRSAWIPLYRAVCASRGCNGSCTGRELSRVAGAGGRGAFAAWTRVRHHRLRVRYAECDVPAHVAYFALAELPREAAASR